MFKLQTYLFALWLGGCIPSILQAQGMEADQMLKYKIPASECSAEEGRIQVLLLGSYHMSNPGMDAFNLEADDVTTPKRQAELQALADRLKAFNPTKIAIEHPFGDSTAQGRYEQYLAGEIELRRAEEEQIGFRLGKMLGHEQIYAIDNKMNLDQGNMERVIAVKPELGQLMGELQQTGQNVMKVMGEWLASKTIGEMLYQMNRPEFLHLSHALYLQYFAPVVAGDNYAGADLVATWYHRNIRIFSNLHQISDADEERILVIYGQGHIPILKEMIGYSPYFCLVESLAVS